MVWMHRLGDAWRRGLTPRTHAPRAKEWDVDFGDPPTAACKENTSGSGIFSREYGKATVSWDCNKGVGDIAKMKAGFEAELVNPPLKGKSAWTGVQVEK